MVGEAGNSGDSLENRVGQGPSSSKKLSPEQENAFVKELTQYISTTSSPVKGDVNKIFGKHGASISDYAVCIVTESVHSQLLTTYIGKGQPQVKPELIPPKLLLDLQIGNFCDDHRDEIGIKTALGININDMKTISYFVIPEEELGDDFVDKMIKTVEEYGEEQLGYRLIKYKPVWTSYIRYAIVFHEKNTTSNKKLAVYESIKRGKPITKSELATRLKVGAQVEESFVEAAKGPPSTIPQSTEEYAQRDVEIGNTYLVEELKKPIKQEYVSAINKLLAGAGQTAYEIDHIDPRKVMFFIGDRPNEYTDPQSGKEKRELAIKGILDMQLTLEMRIAGKSIGDKDIGKTGYDPTTNFLDIGK